MNLDAGELYFALIDCLTLLVLKYPFPEASQRMHHSDNDTIASEIAGGQRFSGTLLFQITSGSKRCWWLF
jgi:hypothetical protein